MDTEIWKPVVGYEGLYEVSSLGNIRSLTRYVNNNGGRMLLAGRLIKANKDKDGYLCIGLHYNDLSNTQKIHRLVCKAFLINLQNHPVVNHKNGIKTDNRLENLEWCTMAYNNKEAFRIGLKEGPNKGKFGKDNPTAKKVIQWGKGGEIIKEWGSLADIAYELGLDRSGISKCCKGKYKSLGGFIFKYK